MEICQMDQGCEGFLSEMTWIHFGAKAMFITERGAFGESDYTSSDMLFSEGRPPRKAF